MTPYEIVLTIALAGVVGYLVATRRSQKSPPVAPSLIPQTPIAPPPASIQEHADNELVKHAISEMSKVAQLALAPYPDAARTPDAQLGPARSMGGLETIKDDESDPMEVFLGPEFLRTSSAVLDATDESPFGVPGLQPINLNEIGLT